ncbi:hypothetical protein, partial [Mesorhizobium sp. M7A.F.Ca.CA.001.14.1.1]|uniref:hypothetical protein n=1 Tax=Mesorhizobium sp. M7A.F.Ca.CA.001.14.1.1 TaxID=2496706 RepID=UPI0019D4BFDF
MPAPENARIALSDAPRFKLPGRTLAAMRRPRNRLARTDHSFVGGNQRAALFNRARSAVFVFLSTKAASMA